jgi:hypothetical protein
MIGPQDRKAAARPADEAAPARELNAKSPPALGRVFPPAAPPRHPPRKPGADEPARRKDDEIDIGGAGQVGGRLPR